MSLQWTFVAGLLYTEIALLVILMVPFIKPYMWQKLFRSRLITTIAAYGYIYFNVFIFILVLLFLDAIREVRKYSVGVSEVDLKNNPQSEVMIHMKLFRAQRNLYIAGFAFFLWIVLKRMSGLISEEATLIASNHATKKQAENASDMAQKLMDEKDELEKQIKESRGKVSRSGSMAEIVVAAVADNETTRELTTVKQELKETKAALEKAETDLSALKKQAEGTNTEYDRLLKEHSQLQTKIELEESKKDM